MKKIRLDLLLIEKKLFNSRNEAQSAIVNQQIFVNEEMIVKPGTLVNIISNIKVKKIQQQFVSRGGYKLWHALKQFNIVLNNLICLDIGSSTGGFTDCILQNNAKKVYSVDVGTNQLVWKLRIDPRVVVMEKTNFRYVTKDNFPETINFVAIDVSFISLKKIIIPLVEILESTAQLICLIKPQFEATRKDISKGGVVKKLEVHYSIIKDLIDFLEKNQFSIQNLTYSPILGNKKGNIEYLIYANFKTKNNSKKINIMKVINDAKNTLKTIKNT